MKFASLVAFTAALTLVSAAPLFSPEYDLEARGAQVSSSKEFAKKSADSHKVQDSAKKYDNKLKEIEASNKSAQEKFVAKNRAGAEYGRAVKKHSRDLDEVYLERRDTSLRAHSMKSSNFYRVQRLTTKYDKKINDIEASEMSAKEKNAAKDRALRWYDKTLNKKDSPNKKNSPKKKNPRDLDEEYLERRDLFAFDFDLD